MTGMAKASNKSNGHGQYKDDVESNRNATVKNRFRNVVTSIIEDERRKKMKNKLIEAVDHETMEKYRTSQEQLKQMSNKKIKRFYEDQNERLNDWLEVDMIVKHLADDVLDSFDRHDEDGDGIPEGGALQGTSERIEPFLPQEEREKRQKDRKHTRWAINTNVIANILLLGAKIVAVFFSQSLSLIASLTDSALDLLCTLIVYTTNKLVAAKIASLRKRFPVGRKRLEPLGILVFSIIMVVSFLQILQESVKKLMPGSPREAKNLPPPAIFAMVITVVGKGIIGLGCMRFKTTQVQALVQDCKTDVIFNTISLLFPLIGHAFNIWWLDPVGAGLLSLFIIYDWASTCLENVSRLTGVGADDKVFKKMLYLAWRFSPIVDAYKSLKAYHAGDGIWVEVDILLDEKTPLEHCHDVAETMQYCLEGLDEVDRAFVTVDYTSSGPTGHAEEAG